MLSVFEGRIFSCKHYLLLLEFGMFLHSVSVGLREKTIAPNVTHSKENPPRSTSPAWFSYGLGGFVLWFMGVNKPSKAGKGKAKLCKAFSLRNKSKSSHTKLRVGISYSPTRFLHRLSLAKPTTSERVTFAKKQRAGTSTSRSKVM